MQIRFYLDEDAMSRALTHNLRVRGIDVLTVSEAGKEALGDEEQLVFAQTQGRVIYTCNVRDFQRLHTEYLTQGKEHAGIILLAQQTFSIGEQLRRVLRLMKAKSAESMKNGLEYLSNW